MRNFYKNKNIFITGHTGFKGSWLCNILVSLGANVTGYALEPPTNPNLFKLSGIESSINSVIGDIRDLELLKSAFYEAQPEIVIHMAAQPLVRESYEQPVYTYETNVMGTVNILECIRLSSRVKSFLNVTTDKVYENKEWDRGYREDDRLNGFDPYSNSKSCSELVTGSYINSFFKDKDIAISTARAGNVIGGGDFSKDRIIPDCIRAVANGEAIMVRNPYSTRPYQHVLEPLMAYLTILKMQYEDKSYADSYNVGPKDSDCINTGRLTDIFCEHWGKSANWINKHDGGPHEAGFLKLDCSKIERELGWKPKWDVDKAVEKTVEWTKEYMVGKDVKVFINRQIEEYISLDNM